MKWRKREVKLKNERKCQWELKERRNSERENLTDEIGSENKLRIHMTGTIPNPMNGVLTLKNFIFYSNIIDKKLFFSTGFYCSPLLHLNQKKGGWL